VLARLDDDPDVTVLRQPENAGPSAARNRALEQLETSYFLPIDADDELLPDALERMLAQLETAHEDVGFVYPNWRHIGNQFDEVEVPAYNAWLLMQQNYCGTPALFDRRLFDGTGISYPEEIVVGHEDWDLILELTERGVHGVPAVGPTFLYRKQGFSRVSAVDYGPDSFHGTIERRHPHLYLNRDAIKADWAPALSLVLLDETAASWAPDDLDPLARQTCQDFELVARTELADGVRPIRTTTDSPDAWLQASIDEARGRWILLLPRSAVVALQTASFVEQLIYAFVANEGTSGVVLADAPEISRCAFSQLDDTERLRARPAAVAFERPRWGRVPEVPLSVTDSPLADLAVGLQAIGSVQWRLTPASGGGRPWSECPREPPGGSELDLNLSRSKPGAERAMRHMLAHQTPRLPELTPGTVRRWDPSEPWTPPQTQLLCRHLDPKTGFRAVNVERKSPPGYEFERILGCTRLFPAPGARRLVHAKHTFGLVEEGSELAEGEYELGYVEEQPLPMLEALELRRVPGSGQEILVCGADDPLTYDSERIAILGWTEAHPILPRGADILHTGPWAVDSLRRQVDRGSWRHCYGIDSSAEAPDGDPVGSLQRHAGPDLVALRLRPDGKLASDLCMPGRASRDPRKVGRWLAEPLVFAQDAVSRAKGTQARLRHLALHARARRLIEEDGVILGYLRRQNGPGSSTLYSTVHPVTGDQLVTRFPQEAIDAGYVMDGILGAIFDPPGDASAPPEEMPWARISRG
jgi:hypothetical protein